MARLKEIVEGWTSRLSFQVLDDGAAADRDGLTVTALDIVGNDGVAVDTSNDFGWIDDSVGSVYYDPDAADFVASKSPYRVRYQLTDGSGKVAWWPDGAADTIVVHARGV